MSQNSPEEEDKDTLRELVGKNEALKAQLLALNAEIDRQLKLKGAKVRTGVGMAPKNPIYDSPAVKENERVKKENAKLLRRLHENHHHLEITTLQDAITERKKKAKELRDQKASLEQVARHQGKGLENVQRFEEEINALRRTHAEEVAKLKEELKAERAAKDDAQRAIIANQAKISALRERIQAANGPLAQRWAKIDELKQELASKDEELEQLGKEVEEAKKAAQSGEEMRKLRREQRELNQEVSRLQEAIEATRVKIVEADKVLQMSASPYLWKYKTADS